MDLKDYITEYVSSGRGIVGNKPYYGCDINDILEWLDSKGVEGSKNWNMRIPKPSKKGDLIYQLGPCDPRDTGTFWVSVANYIGDKDMERIVIYTNVHRKDSSFYTHWYSGELIYIDFDTAIDAVEFMIDNPKKSVKKIIKESEDAEYITEYVSSGRGNNNYDRIQLGDELDDILVWLKRNNIPGYSWSKTHSIPRCDKGKLVYFSGPWIQSKEWTKYIVVRNGFGQHVRLNLAERWESESYFHNSDGEETKVGLSMGLDILDRMIRYPDKKIELKDGMVVEYVSSGRGNPKYILPDKDIDSVVAWLETLGVDNFKKWDGTITYAPENGIVAEIGPCRKNKNGTFWISVYNNPSGSKDGQRIVARQYIESEVKYNAGNTEIISFDEAIRLMKKMISDPTKPIGHR